MRPDVPEIRKQIAPDGAAQIIPLKERVVDRFYDPVSRLLRMFE